MSPIPYVLVIQVRAADGWRAITSYRYDLKDESRKSGRADAMRQARLGIRAWREYHLFADRALRIAECVPDAAFRPQWIEVVP